MKEIIEENREQVEIVDEWVEMRVRLGIRN